nr:hypothetical protein [Microctonus hyperodae filamentous virus]
MGLLTEALEHTNILRQTQQLALQAYRGGGAAVVVVKAVIKQQLQMVMGAAPTPRSDILCCEH